jgi:hypothetical protein
MARRSALVDHQMNHIPKSFNDEATEDFLATGAYRTSPMARFVQHPSAKQFSMSGHTITSIGKIGAPLCSLGGETLTVAKNGLTSELCDIIVKPIFLNSEKH